MQVSISARHGHLSEASQQRISEKVEKLVRIFERVTAIEVTIDLEHEDKPEVELQVSAEHKKEFVATDSAPELMAALDSCMHKMEQQLRKYKEKIQDHRRGEGLRQQVASEAEPPEEV